MTVRQNYENLVKEHLEEIEKYKKLLSENNPDLDKPYKPCGFDWSAV